MSVEGSYKFKNSKWKKRELHLNESQPSPETSPPPADVISAVEELKKFPEIIEAIPKLDDKTQISLLKEKINDQTVMCKFLEAKLGAVTEQLNHAKITKGKIEAEKPILEKNVQHKKKEVGVLVEEMNKAEKAIQELEIKLKNREISKKKLETECSELGRFLSDKEKELSGLKAKIVVTDFGTQTEGPEKTKEKSKIITIKQYEFESTSEI